MSGVREVVDGVLAVEVAMSAQLSTTVVLLEDAHPTLVDAGTARQGPRAVRAAVAARGLGPPQTVVVTHFHHDHTGGLAQMCADWSVEVLAHVAEAHLVEHPGAFQEALARSGGPAAGGPPSAVGVTPQPVLDGARLAVGGLAWEILHTPGHTWGHVVLWCPDDGVLVAGDAVQGAGVPYRGVPGQGTGLPYYLDVTAYRASLERMRDLEPRVLVLAHDNPAWEDSTLLGDAAVEALDASLDISRRLDELVLEALEDGLERRAEIADRLCRALGSTGGTVQAGLTVGTHLDGLRRAGRLPAAAHERLTGARADGGEAR